MAILQAKLSNSSRTKQRYPDNTLNFDSPIVFDLETTGVNPRTCEVIQIAAIHPESGATFEVKLDFDRELASESALQVNSFDEKVWRKESVPPADGLKGFIDFCSRHRNLPRRGKSGSTWQSVVLAGYNSSWFDMPLLKRMIEKYLKGTFTPWDPRSYDVMQWALFAFPGHTSYKLGEIAVHLDCYEDGGHDALQDCKTTVAVAKRCLSEIYDDESLPKWARKS